MKAIFGIFCFALMFFIILCGVIQPNGIDKQSRQYKAWLEDRAINEHRESKVWSR